MPSPRRCCCAPSCRSRSRRRASSSARATMRWRDPAISLARSASLTRKPGLLQPEPDLGREGVPADQVLLELLDLDGVQVSGRLQTGDEPSQLAARPPLREELARQRRRGDPEAGERGRQRAGENRSHAQTGDRHGCQGQPAPRDRQGEAERRPSRCRSGRGCPPRRCRAGRRTRRGSSRGSRRRAAGRRTGCGRARPAGRRPARGGRRTLDEGARRSGRQEGRAAAPPATRCESNGVPAVGAARSPRRSRATARTRASPRPTAPPEGRRSRAGVAEGLATTGPAPPLRTSRWRTCDRTPHRWRASRCRSSRSGRCRPRRGRCPPSPLRTSPAGRGRRARGRRRR